MTLGAANGTRSSSPKPTTKPAALENGTHGGRNRMLCDFSLCQGVRTKCSLSMFQDPWLRTVIRNLGLILIWFTLSTGLSIYNKQLVGTNSGLFGKGAFPAPLLLSSVQFALQALIAKVVFASGLVERRAQKLRSWRDYSLIGIPNGIVSGLDIGFSMKSLAYITMSFYTMCKSTVPVFLLLFAFIWKIEQPSWELGFVVSVITLGLGLLVKGESNFHVLGFSLVMIASCFSGLRFTLTQLLLHGHADSPVAMAGPLEVLEMLTPVMSITVLAFSLGWEQLWTTLPTSPYFASWQHVGLTLAIVFVGATLAFTMVWTEYTVIRETSALTFMMAGTCKEVFTVMAGVLVMGDHFGFINGVGLIIIIIGVLLFNWYKYRRIKAGGRLGGHTHAASSLGDSDIELAAQQESVDVAEQEHLPLLPLPAGVVLNHR